MQDDRISERRITFHDEKDFAMVARHNICKRTLAKYMRVNFADSLEGDKEYRSFRFAIVPRLSTIGGVSENASEIFYQICICDAADITLFKIPFHVNDVKRYVKMLLREHYNDQ